MTARNADQLNLFDQAADRLMRAVDRLEETTQPLNRMDAAAHHAANEHGAIDADRERLLEALAAAHEREQVLNMAITETSAALDSAISEVREALKEMA